MNDFAQLGILYKLYWLETSDLNTFSYVGIGGFQVRARGKKEEEKAREEALLDPLVLEQRRKRSNWRTKKKIKLLEKFPSYIQVCDIWCKNFNCMN